MPSNSWINGAKVSWSWVTESIHYYQCILYVYATAAAMIIFFFMHPKCEISYWTQDYGFHTIWISVLNLEKVKRK